MSNPGQTNQNSGSTSQSPFLLTPNQQHQGNLSPDSGIAEAPRSGSKSKPKMPRSESFNPSPPHRPDFNRAAHSSFNVGGSSTNGAYPVEDNGDELTTKGRKRKRLAKACSACHKNKRRCDGFDPCSNCEFSSKECMYLNAQGQRIPAPRTREASTTPQRPVRDEHGRIIHPARSSHGSGDWQRGDEPNKRRGSLDRSFNTPYEVVERDAALSVELIDLFFHHVQPYGAMLHRPTFLNRLYTRQVSPVLLDMIYALGARHCIQPALLASMPASKPSHMRGEVFAERANLAAKQCLHIRASWSRLQRDFDRGTYEETEFVQALYLLSVHYSGLDHPALADHFFDEAVAIIHPSASSTIYPPPSRLAVSPSEYLTLTEIRHRTFWMILLHDLTATAAGNRPRRLQDHEIYNIPLPGDEAHWLRYGAESRSGADRGRRDGIAVGTGNWDGEEGAVGEIGHVIRVLLVFHDIVSATGARHSSKSLTTANHEATLWAWSTSLPPHLHFDQTRLQMAVARLSSSVPEISQSGFLYAYMHMIAECGMLYVQAAKAQVTGMESTSSATMLRTMENISILLEHLGSRGRESYLILYPLSILTEWFDSLRSGPGDIPPEDAVRLHGRLSKWWNEARNQWGVKSPLRPDMREAAEPARSSGRDIGYEPPTSAFSVPMSARSNSCSLAKPSMPQRFSPPGPRTSNGLGLELHSSARNNSPREMTMPESASSTTTLTLPTPTSSFKYPDMASFISVRPRAHSNVSTLDITAAYPSRSPRSPDHDSGPGLGLKLGDREKGLTLPSLSSISGNRGRSNSWWRDHKAERSPLGIAALISAAEERGEV